MNFGAEQVQAALQELLESGAITTEQVSAIMQAVTNDPALLDQFIGQLKAAGADQVGPSPPLNIEDYYRDGDGTFELQWPLQTALPYSFDMLDRKTRFYALFQDWTRRELQGLTMLNSGQSEEAAAVFEECLGRARQLNVNELIARSYENLMRVADKAGDPKASRKYSEAAVAARANE